MMNYFALALEIGLVAQDDERKCLRIAQTCLTQELVLPLVQVLERRRRCDIKHNHACIRPLVEDTLNALVLLLSCSIPDLHSDELFLGDDLLRQKVGADGSLILWIEASMDISTL